jgi:hypothetical protein
MREHATSLRRAQSVRAMADACSDGLWVCSDVHAVCSDMHLAIDELSEAGFGSSLRLIAEGDTSEAVGGPLARRSVPHMLRAEVGLLGRGSESTAGRHNGGLLFSRRRDSLSGEGSWIPSPSSCC